MSVRFSRVPEDVLTSPNLCATDIRVYAAMSLHVYDGNVVAVGQRRLAKVACVDRRTLRRSLTNLARGGFICVAVKPLGRRSAFVLNSTVFGDSFRLREDGELGGEKRPLVGGEKRPRLYTRTGDSLVSFPKKA